ncbi:MAG: hypothetical protein ABI561_20890 [Bradyrhizobium sp.]
MKPLSLYLPIITIAVASFVAAASAAGVNDTPRARDCMAKNGFNIDMWHAHRAGTNQQVQSYIQCRDGVSSSQALAKGRKDGNYGKGY